MMNYSIRDFNEDKTFEALRYYAPWEAWVKTAGWIEENKPSFPYYADSTEWKKFYTKRDQYTLSLGHSYHNLYYMFG